jgi:5-formyltetrahydrofolate cyclo-ligase
MPKHLLRKTILARRRALSVSEQEDAGNIIQDTFMALPEYLAAGSVALYAPVHKEVSTGRVVNHALAAGKALFFPAVEGDSMVFRRIYGLDDLICGSFGIMQPGPGCTAAEPEEIEQIVVPGVGFDLSGQRIGYGKGYYDRSLHKLEASGRLTAFCYEFQLVDSLKSEKHDVVMDRIITERRVITPALLK